MNYKAFAEKYGAYYSAIQYQYGLQVAVIEFTGQDVKNIEKKIAQAIKDLRRYKSVAIIDSRWLHYSDENHYLMGLAGAASFAEYNRIRDLHKESNDLFWQNMHDAQEQGASRPEAIDAANKAQQDFNRRNGLIV